MPRPKETRAFFRRVVVDEWEKARQIPDILEDRVFRGQSKAAWGLETSIERIAARQDYPLGQLAERERHMVREFQRRRITTSRRL